MFPGSLQHLRMVASLLSHMMSTAVVKGFYPYGTACCLLPRRCFGASGCISAKSAPGRQKPRERVEIPGLEMITYDKRMHYVPGLAKPVYKRWERDYKDPRFYTSPPAHEMPLYKDKPCYIYNQRTSALEGVRQALWLTKSKLISGLPPQLLSMANSSTNQIADQDERVQNAIKNARFWDTTEERPGKKKYSNKLLYNLLHLCATLQSRHPGLGRRIFAEKYSLAATWSRGQDLFQIRGQNGILHNCMDPLPKLSGRQEVADTENHVLETFYPVSPTIDLQKVQVYHEEIHSTGFTVDYSYPHPHTLYFLDGVNDDCKLLPEQFRAKILMFTFGSALACAHKLYGTQPQHILDRPITVQAVGTNGRIFQFLVFQLNTTKLTEDNGIKNQVWLDEDVQLYDFAKVRPLIKKKEIMQKKQNVQNTNKKPLTLHSNLYTEKFEFPGLQRIRTFCHLNSPQNVHRLYPRAGESKIIVTAGHNRQSTMDTRTKLVPAGLSGYKPETFNKFLALYLHGAV